MFDYMTHANKAFTAALDNALETYPSKAAQKRVLENLNTAYDHARSAYGDLYRVDLFAKDEAAGGRSNWDADAFLAEREVPFDLHNVRDRHLVRLAEYSPEAARLAYRALKLRADVKTTPVEAPVKTNVKIEERKIAVQKTIREEMDRLGRMYADALDLGRMFNGLNVSANVHLVTNQFGTTFVRAFYYYEGKRAPLNLIMAACEKLADEKKGR